MCAKNAWWTASAAVSATDVWVNDKRAEREWRRVPVMDFIYSLVVNRTRISSPCWKIHLVDPCVLEQNIVDRALHTLLQLTDSESKIKFD